MSAYMRCPDCRGYGVVEGPNPDVRTCFTCLGGGEVRARDERGRYTAAVLPAHAKSCRYASGEQVDPDPAQCKFCDAGCACVGAYLCAVHARLHPPARDTSQPEPSYASVTETATSAPSCPGAFSDYDGQGSARGICGLCELDADVHEFDPGYVR